MDKIKIEAQKKGDRVEIVGLDEIIFHCLEQENLLGIYERFMEHVTIACVMPEVPRYALDDGRHDDTMVSGALDALQTLLMRYRKMTAWFRANNIDIDSVVGNDTGKARS